MKVLHISSERSWRGGEQQIAYLIEELRAKNVENIVICRKNSAFEAYCTKNHLPFHSLSFSPFSLLTSAYKLKKLTKSLNADIVHMHTSKAHIIMYVAYLLGAQIPGAVSRRVDFQPGSNFFTRHRYRLKQIKRIICVSDAINVIMTQYLHDSGKCVTVHSGVDMSKFEVIPSFDIKLKLDLKKNDQIIGNTSALADHKDYFTFIDTAEILIKKRGLPVTFIILGDGPLKTDIVTYINEKKLEDHIHLVGFVNNVNEWLKQFDVFMMTSKSEGLGTSIIDAMASKVPVIGTRAGGIPELIKHGETGLLAETKQPEQLADYVEQLICDKELAKRLVQGAHDHVQNFSKEATATKTYDVYKTILNY